MREHRNSPFAVLAATERSRVQAEFDVTAAHEHGSIHRDLEPANTILRGGGNQDDIARVVDFGLVKNSEASDDVAINAATSITGTPLLVSSGIARTPGRVDGRRGLYSVGVLGYYLLTGNQLFDSEDAMKICSHHPSTRTARPSERVDRLIAATRRRMPRESLPKPKL